MSEAITHTPDSCQRFLFADADARGEIVRLRGAYQQVVGNHEYPQAVRELLGEFLSAAVLLGAGIKYDGRLVIQVRGNGEVDLLMAECTSEGAVRGIARFGEPPQSADFDSLTGAGVMVITVDSRRSEPYQGIVTLQGGSLATSLEGYFEQSEQLQSWFLFAVDDTQACGFMLQQLPTDKQKGPAERAAKWEHLQMLAQTLTRDELLNLDNAEILRRLYHQEPVELFEARPFYYQCSCSRERTTRALISLGQNEVESIVAEQGAVGITCEFCGTEYQFDASEVALLFQGLEDTLH